MSTEALPYRCPACGFGIHNRRYPRCERCAEALPAALLYSAEDIARLDAEAEAADMRRAKRDAPAGIRDPDEDATSLVVMSAASVATLFGSGDCSGGTGSG